MKNDIKNLIQGNMNTIINALCQYAKDQMVDEYGNRIPDKDFHPDMIIDPEKRNKYLTADRLWRRLLIAEWHI